MAFSKILVPTDFSEHSAEALKVAAALSRAFAAPLRLLAVHQPMMMPIVPEGALFPLAVDMADDVARINTKLQEAEQAATAAGAVNVSSALRQGVAYEQILAEATEEGTDVIVMGTHGRTGLKHVLLGSVAEKVVRQAPCAVLTVRAHPRS
jgi:nucleotide-binding universal stress UspA family protein